MKNAGSNTYPACTLLRVSGASLGPQEPCLVLLEDHLGPLVLEPCLGLLELCLWPEFSRVVDGSRNVASLQYIVSGWTKAYLHMQVLISRNPNISSSRPYSLLQQQDITGVNSQAIISYSNTTLSYTYRNTEHCGILKICLVVTVLGELDSHGCDRSSKL